MNMKMQNRVRMFSLILIVICANSMFSQNLSENWKLIKNDDISQIFIDPSKIVEYGNEISVWAIEKLNEPKKSEKNEKIYSIKTHYLFNKMKKRYSEIGVIYYGAKGGIVNRSSKASFNGGPTAFSTPISANKNSEVVYKEVISYLITGNVAEVERTSNSIVEDVISEESEVEVKKKEKTPKVIPARNKDISVKVENSDNLKIEAPVETKKLEENLTMDISAIPKSEVSVKEIKKVGIQNLPEIKITENEYNFDKERALKNAIFTDGNLYCFQVSSWKRKSIANREVNKLISKGYKAFLVSVKPKHKKSIWHRVRVGYFNSLKETKRTQREIR